MTFIVVVGGENFVNVGVYQKGEPVRVTDFAKNVSTVLCKKHIPVSTIMEIITIIDEFTLGHLRKLIKRMPNR